VDKTGSRCEVRSGRLLAPAVDGADGSEAEVVDELIPVLLVIPKLHGARHPRFDAAADVRQLLGLRVFPL